MWAEAQVGKLKADGVSETSFGLNFNMETGKSKVKTFNIRENLLSTSGQYWAFVRGL